MINNVIMSVDEVRIHQLYELNSYARGRYTKHMMAGEHYEAKEWQQIADSSLAEINFIQRKKQEDKQVNEMLLMLTKRLSPESIKRIEMRVILNVADKANL